MEVLKTKMQSWTMSVPGTKQTLHVATVDGWGNDSGRAAISAVLEDTKSLPVAVLTLRSTPLKLLDRVYVIGCADVTQQCRAVCIQPESAVETVRLPVVRGGVSAAN